MAVETIINVSIEPGQIWRDQDPRKKRHIKVLHLSPDHERVFIETVEKHGVEWRRKKGARISGCARDRFGRKGDNGFAFVEAL